MNREKIKALLEKYYNGDTTLEEEEELRTYFNGTSIDQEFLPYRDIFIFSTHEIEAAEDIPEFGDEILENINNHQNRKTQKNRKIINYTLSIAASISILIVSFFFIQNEFKNEHANSFQDTYENPELAYLQAKEALLYVSAKLNSGTEHLEPLQTIDKGADELRVLSTFNQGLNELKTFEKYNVVKKYIK
ncbi:MAG: hypothetical protein V2I54_07000 [Bacteroidales bacterium]|jgi:hypothetical protein|nr:hypothetical protein [Bacteroidales bacterium]